MLLRKRKQLFNNQFILLTISKFTLMKKLFVCALALAAFVACDNGPEGGVVNPEAGNVYMQFSVKMETTRSQTDTEGDTNSNANPDFEVGKDYENKVSNVDIVLMDNAGAVAARAADITLAQAATDTYVASFNTTALNAGTQYYVYIVTNGTFKSLENVTEVGNDLTATGGIAEKNKFLMTNAMSKENNVTTLPADLTPYTSPQNPFNLGAFKVERAAARFDYKAAKTDNVYAIGLNKENVATVNVKLVEAALINMSKKFYDFRRVSDNGLADGANFLIGGVENPNNYVVDTDAADKNTVVTDNAEATLSATNFHYSLVAPATWVWKSLAVTEDDNWTGANGEDGYKIWTYASENTIPGIANQVNGISTGIVFKGELSATDAAPAAAKAAIEAGTEMIYVFKEQLYGTWNDVKTAATAADADAELAAAYNTVVAAGENAVAKTYADAGFTGYKPEGGKYYAYYYYWNRHNDNLDNYVMGNMEFAVVRNNVYKLCVDKISKFGHPDPKDPENPDPDPVDPTDPDEEKNYYFNVTVKVLPWVVRLNNIEF